MRYWIFLSFLIHNLVPSYAQDINATATIIGTVTDQKGAPLIGANVYIDMSEPAIGTQTNIDGKYKLIIPADERITLVFSYLGFAKQKKAGIKLEKGKAIRVDIQMVEEGVNTGPTAIITPFEEKEIDAINIKAEDIREIPTTDMNLTSLIKYLAPGVSAGTGGELTSQYSVRGGNYDENLVYVNGFEIYRPLLIRSGQQEGLTFPNPDMLRNMTFSAGAFKAQYGDKMSSVLDVNYRRPYELEASVSGSLLGASAYIGGAIYRDSASRKSRSPYRLTYTFGARYKTSQYILNTLDIKGQYVPNFWDVQGDIIYDINAKWQLEVIGHYSNSIYKLIPEAGEQTTGLFNRALRLTTVFDGQELSNFENFTAGTSLTFVPWGKLGKTRDDGKKSISSNLRFRLLGSHYQSNENERIDILSFYKLDEVETGLGEDDFGEVVGTLAYGETHQFARNYLQANVTNAQLRGVWTYEEYNDSTTNQNRLWLRWGAGYKNEIIQDKLKEWTRFDSLGYSLPYDTTQLVIPEYINTNISLNSHRMTAYVQNTWEHISKKHLFRMTAGVRAQYWTLNQEFIVSPRIQLYYTPRKFSNPESDLTTVTKDLTFKLAAGSYYQPPFYRELRDLEGNVKTDVRSQKSIHVLGGVVWDFMMFKRRFKLIAEGYYKHQWDLVPYDVENVRIRYYGDNLATGYVAGLDFRLNGRLVDGLESWINLSLLRARESFTGVQHGIRTLSGVSTIDTTLVSDVPKPTDQLVIFSMYFQDYFPKLPWFKVNLGLTIGTGLSYGIPRNNIEFRNIYRFSPYHRIDIGFSFNLWNRARFVEKKYENNLVAYRKSKHAFKWLKRAWLSIEVFNLMDVRNVASNTWVKDFTNRSYAIPNSLTTRRINVRFRLDF